MEDSPIDLDSFKEKPAEPKRREAKEQVKSMEVEIAHVEPSPLSVESLKEAPFH